jgi:hypothetical protein
MEEQRWAPLERGTEQGTAGERSSYRNTAPPPLPPHPPPGWGGGEGDSSEDRRKLYGISQKGEKLGQYMQLVESSS